MIRRHVYLLLAVIGFIVPYYFFISFLSAHGLDVRLFFRQLFGTPISTFFAADLLLSCLIFARFSGQEAARHEMKHQWVYLVALCTVGLSFALRSFSGRASGICNRNNQKWHRL